jgi:diguanylate cyclase (GGDEF)-like protein/PAS domain S-box-containing protein
LKTLLRPAVFLLNRLSYPHKLALIGFVFFLPFFVAGYLMVSETSASITFAERELAGLQSVRPLKKLMRIAQEHRGTAQLALLDDLEALQRLDHLEQMAGEVIQELDAFDAEFGKTMKISDEWGQVKSRWNNLLRKTITVSAEESFSLHTAFVECVQVLQLHISDASGLSLEPALDTHYLIFAVTFPLNQWTESLGQARALSAVMAQKQSFSLRERYQLSKVVGESQRIGAKVQADLETALTLTPGLRKRMGSTLKEAHSAMASFLSSAEELLLEPNSILHNGQAMFQQGTLAVNAVYHLCEATLPALQETIQARSDQLVLKRYALLAIGVAAGLLAAYLFLAFTSALMKQLDALRQGAKAVVEGNLNTQVVQDSHDEMATIAYFFNGMVDSIRYQRAKAAQGETELRQSEEKYRSLMDQANDAFVVVDLEGKLLDVNRAAEKMFGYSKEELLRMHALDLHPEEERDLVLKTFQSLRDNGTSQAQAQVRRKDGMIILVDVSGALVKYEGGVMAVGIFHDISALKRTEEQLRLAATVFEGTDEGIMITDASGVIVSVNRAFSELTGYPSQEAVGKTPALLKSGRHPSGYYQEMWQEVLATGSWQGEVWDRRKGGALFPAWLTINVVRGENGAPRYFVGIFSDISLIKESQRRIEYLANFDALTGLPNRNLFHDRLKHAVARAARQGDGFALMFIDLDNFKAVNDTLGHDAGDLLLQEAARRLEKCIRDGDTAARLGGDEFTVLLETSDKVAVAGTAQRIVEVLAAAFTLRDSEVYVTCSIGISIHPDDGADDQAMMKNADIAMYRAKQQGKNNFLFFGD